VRAEAAQLRSIAGAIPSHRSHTLPCVVSRRKVMNKGFCFCLLASRATLRRGVTVGDGAVARGDGAARRYATPRPPSLCDPSWGPSPLWAKGFLEWTD